MGLIRRGVLVAGALLVASVVSIGVASLTGIASAQTPLSGPGDRYETLLAQKLGITVDQLKAAQKAARDQLIDEAVTANKLTPDQAAKLKAAAPGDKLKLHFEMFEKGARFRGAVSDLIAAVTKVTGLSAQELKNGLGNGQSLMQLAQAKGISRDNLRADLRAELQAQIQLAVTNKKLTQTQADALKNAVDQHIDAAIDTAGPRIPALGGPGFGGGEKQFPPRAPRPR